LTARIFSSGCRIAQIGDNWLDLRQSLADLQLGGAHIMTAAYFGDSALNSMHPMHRPAIARVSGFAACAASARACPA
jgi:hypothetical protein